MHPDAVSRSAARPLLDGPQRQLAKSIRSRCRQRLHPSVTIHWRAGSVPSTDPEIFFSLLCDSVGERHAHIITARARPITQFERSGLLQPPRSLASSMTDFFARAWDTQILPAAQVPRTRSSYDGPWAAFVVFAVADFREFELLPASRTLLQAFAAYLLSFRLRPNTIRRYLQAIRDRHVRGGFRHAVPTSEVTTWMRAIHRQGGRPPASIGTFSAGHLRKMLLLPTRVPLDVETQQAILATCLATAIACRPSELVNIDVCDILFQYFQDPPGTAAVRIWGGKTDVQRKGHFPRLGRPVDPRCDLVAILRKWCRRHHLAVSPLCSKRSLPGRACSACGPLFRYIRSPLDAGVSASAARWSTARFTHAVRCAVSAIGLDPRLFEARSCRSSGISIAVEHGVPDFLIALQSGHAVPRAGPGCAMHGYIRIPAGQAVFRYWDSLQL